jgi:hypothetical protein
MLGQDDLARKGLDRGLKLATFLTGTIRGPGFAGEVAHVKDRATRTAPSGQQAADILFRLQIVPAAPVVTNRL